jgi:Zn-dependent protease with chaperone function
MPLKTCPNCYSPITPGAKFCRACGKPIIATPPLRQPQAQNQAPIPHSPPPLVEENLPVQAPKSMLKRPITWIIIVILAVGCILCLAAVGGGWAYYQGWFNLARSGGTSTPVSLAVPNTPEPNPPSITPMPSPTATETLLPPLEGTLTPTSNAIPTLTPIIIPGLNIEIPHVTDEEEIQIGQETAREFEREVHLSNNTSYLERVNRIGQAILPFQPRPNIPFNFKVIETDEVNAFALPGGFVYVTRGLLEFVESDDELAGVIGHEIAHVALRHGAQQIEYLAAAEAVLNAIATSDPNFETIYQDEGTQIAITLAATIAFNGWGRQAELDADEYGAVYMHAAGYNPQAIINLFTRFQAYEDTSSGDILTQLLATHPPFADRIARVEQAILEHGLGD